ncbi:unnamed protein product [Trichobilharzia regenti]|nr:unnamed protein product [Trichobilharzia regenti]
MYTTTAAVTLLESNDIQHLQYILKTTRLICGKILTPLLCTIGFIANIINIIILTREWMSSSTNVYLTAVSVCDLLYLLFSCLFSLWIYREAQEIALFAYCITFIHGTANLFSNTTTWLTVGFTLERYIAISSPMLGRRLCTKRRARYVVISIFIFSFTLTLPDYFKNTVEYREKVSSNQMNLSSTVSSSASMIPSYSVVHSRFNPFLTKIGYDYVNQTVFVILPMILLIIFNSLLVRSVMQANHNRRVLTKQTGGNSNNITPTKISLNSKKIKSVDSDTNNTTTNSNNNNNGGKFLGKNIGQQSSQEASTSHMVPAIVREALEASMRTTIEITSGITQSFRPTIHSTGLLPMMNMKRTKLGEQHRITLMLISIVMAFVILQLPSMVPTITNNLWNVGIVQRTPYAEKCLSIYANISNVLLIINAAMNFVFYSLFSAKFRQTCCMLLRNVTCFKQYYKNKALHSQKDSKDCHNNSNSNANDKSWCSIGRYRKKKLETVNKKETVLMTRSNTGMLLRSPTGSTKLTTLSSSHR